MMAGEMERIEMVRLTDFYDAHGYTQGSAEYQRVSRMLRDGRWPVYARSPRVRYIETEVADEILTQVPPPVAAPEDIDDAEPDGGEVAALRRELAELRALLTQATGGAS